MASVLAVKRHFGEYIISLHERMNHSISAETHLKAFLRDELAEVEVRRRCLTLLRRRRNAFSKANLIVDTSFVDYIPPSTIKKRTVCHPEEVSNERTMKSPPRG